MKKFRQVYKCFTEYNSLLAAVGTDTPSGRDGTTIVEFLNEGCTCWEVEVTGKSGKRVVYVENPSFFLNSVYFI